MTPKEALKKYFDHDSFRQSQQEIIDEIIKGENILAVLPTGAGKSICYQIPALICNNFSIVISPLIALMKDQVDSLNKKEEIAAFINSSMSFYEAEEVLRKISFGNIKLLYVAPERLENIQFADRVKNLHPEFLFVDEAHCISEWGHSFRPSYRKIKEFIDYVAISKISGFTATATPEVVKDITVQLGLANPKIFVRGFERDNLHLNVVLTKRKKEKCLELISQHKTPAIIYTASRKRTEEIAEFLRLHNINCTYYHAGLAPEIRKKVQEDFINGHYSVIAATNAFGMGIDKKDIRLVIHYNTPGSIENYYQEIGRAGRDGKSSFVYLLHDDSDINIQNFFIASSHPDKELIQKVYDAICDYGQVAEGNSTTKEIQINSDFISAYVKRDINRGLLYSTLNFLENAGYLRQPSEYENKSSIQITFEKNKLKEFIISNSNKLITELILFLLREYGGKIFAELVHISASGLSKKLGFSEIDVEETLNILDNLGIIKYTKPFSKECVVLTSPRVNSTRLRLDYQKINESYLSQQKKVDRMVDFVYSNDCRFKFILEYFGEDVRNYKCGKCDRCEIEEEIPGETLEYVKEIILRTLNEKKIPLLNESALITVIRGSSKTAKYKLYDTYGCCVNYTKNDIKIVLRDILTGGYAARNPDNNSLFITNSGIEYLDVNGLIKEEIKPPVNYEENLELFNLLREARAKAAKKFMQTGYLICPDELLRAVAEKRPREKSELLSINGFNNRMFNKLGNDFLEIVNEFLSRFENKIIPEAQARTIPQNIKETNNLLLKGYTLKDIASLRKLSEAIISMQVETILEYEPSTDINHLFDGNSYELIAKEIKEGFTDLKELKQRLPAEITYSMIRIASAKYKANSVLNLASADAVSSKLLRKQ
jgi:ATP-dependent DNA helicase RecQ